MLCELGWGGKWSMVNGPGRSKSMPKSTPDGQPSQVLHGSAKKYHGQCSISTQVYVMGLNPVTPSPVPILCSKALYKYLNDKR